MAEQVKDGTGSGFLAGVDGNNRLHAESVESTDQSAASELGDAYNINSGLLTLTSAGSSGILYMKNNEDRDFHITAYVMILGPSSNGSTVDTTLLVVRKNPTTGTLISNAVSADINSNRNFGSSKTLTADVYKGAEGNTVTDGTSHFESLVSPGNRVFFSTNEILTKGDSVSIEYAPPDSNESMKVMGVIVGHLKDLKGVL